MAKDKSSSNTRKKPEPPAIGFAAAITADEMHRGERAAQSYGVTRRIAYAALARSYQQLLDGLRSGGEATAEAALEHLDDLVNYLEWRKYETEMLEGAQARMMFVLQQFSAELLAQ